MAVTIKRRKPKMEEPAKEEPETLYSDFQKAHVPAAKVGGGVETQDPNWSIIEKTKAKAKNMKPKEARDFLDRMANLWGPEVKTHQEIRKLIDTL